MTNAANLLLKWAASLASTIAIPQDLPVPQAEMMHRSTPNGASSINCWVRVGALISGPGAAGAVVGAMAQLDKLCGLSVKN